MRAERARDVAVAVDRARFRSNLCDDGAVQSDAAQHVRIVVRPPHAAVHGVERDAESVEVAIEAGRKGRRVTGRGDDPKFAPLTAVAHKNVPRRVDVELPDADEAGARGEAVVVVALAGAREDGELTR